MTTAPTAGRLSIRQAHNTYLVASQHPAPERLRDRLDAAMTKDLAPILATRLAAWFANADSGLWLIRRLEVTVDVNAAWEREAIARAWARAIVHELSILLQDAGDGVNALWFPNRAAYLARFLVDVAEECAWSKWYYEAFAGLRPLPTSAVLRTAICEQPALGQAALLELAVAELRQVLHALTLQDARRILDSLAEHAPFGGEFDDFQAVWSAWPALPEEDRQGYSLPADDWRSALRLYLEASRRTEQVGGAPLRTATLAILRLARCLAAPARIVGFPAPDRPPPPTAGPAALDGDAGSPGQWLLALLSRSDRTGLYSAVGPADAEILAPLLRCPPDWIQEIGQTLLSRQGEPMGVTLLRCPPAWVQEVGQTLLNRQGEPMGVTAATPERRYTAFGGIFLLLPLLDELPLAEATNGWPDLDEISATALVRFLLLVQCLGQPRAWSVFADSLLRDLLGIPPSLSPTVLADWQARLLPAHLHSFRETLECWYGERGALTGEVQILARSPARGEPVAVLLDGARGIWLSVHSYPPQRLEKLLVPLRQRLAGPGEESAVLVSHADFLAMLHREFPERKVIGFDQATMMETEPELMGILARLPTLPAELAYLSLPRTFPLARPWRRALTVAAQGLLRNFAWRLPGFAGSNLPYLYSNFLDLTASLEDEPDRRVVRLGRPPLHLVLSMTGMLRKSYRLSWLDDRPFALFPET